MNRTLILILILLLASCEKEEINVKEIKNHPLISKIDSSKKADSIKVKKKKKRKKFFSKERWQSGRMRQS